MCILGVRGKEIVELGGFASDFSCDDCGAKGTENDIKSTIQFDTLNDKPMYPFTVRMFGIDAPEMKQEPWGARSRDALRALLPQRAEITLRVRDQDRYGRTIAQVLVGERDAGLDLVRQGRAVVYAQYNDSIAYRQAETEARQARRGIWEQAGGQQDPATWRRLNPR